LISAGALPQTPLGELTALPQTASWYLRGLLLWEGKGKEGGWGKEGKGEEGERGGEEGKGRGPWVCPPQLRNPGYATGEISL